MGYWSGDKRVVETGLPDNTKNNEILRSVIGQMSDGIWEESAYMRPYWEDAEIDGVNINVRTYGAYSQMSDAQVLNFFARKVYTITRMFAEDNYAESVRDRIYAEHGEEYHWMNKREENESVEDFYKRCDMYEDWNEQAKEEVKNNPINFKKVFNKSNETICTYLNYDSKLTVGDAFKCYQSLKDKIKELERSESEEMQTFTKETKTNNKAIEK